MFFYKTISIASNHMKASRPRLSYYTLHAIFTTSVGKKMLPGKNAPRKKWYYANVEEMKPYVLLFIKSLYSPCNTRT